MADLQMTTRDGAPRADEKPISTRIIRVVANRAGEDAIDLPPLFESVEPDALDGLFRPMAGGIPRDGGEVSFSYAGYRVTVSLNRTVDITVTDESD